MSEIAQLGMVYLRDSDLTLAKSADDVRGLTVVDPHDHRLGEIDDLVVDERERRARLLVVTSGGILGLGASERLVPVEAVIRVDEQVHVDRDHMEVHAEPTCLGREEPGDEASYDPQLTDRPRYAHVYGYYGFTPFWSAAYVTPYFHRRY